MNRIGFAGIVVVVILNAMGCNPGLLEPAMNVIPPAQGLIAYYPFTGNSVDASGNGNNGIIRGVTLTNDRFGNAKGAYRFADGSSVLIPELFPETCQAFTFSVWVMKDIVDHDNHVIFYKGLDEGEAAISITDGNLGFGVNLETGMHGAQNWHPVNIPDTLKANTYYSLIGRYERGKQVEFFVNGEFVGSTPVPDVPLAKWAGHSYSAIGTHPQFPTTYYWKGVIDDIRIYNRPLTDKEIQAIYHEKGWMMQ